MPSKGQVKQCLGKAVNRACMYGLTGPHTGRGIPWQLRLEAGGGREKERGVPMDFRQGPGPLPPQSHVLEQSSEDSENSNLNLVFQVVLRIYLSW